MKALTSIVVIPNLRFGLMLFLRCSKRVLRPLDAIGIKLVFLPLNLIENFVAVL